ncbi:nucleotide exchange factor GrpE, partial [bacterium]|nr:nucleotide exchange factor GrpE [bacterium]
SSVGESAGRDGAWAGVELIYKNFAKVLENQGVKPIDAVGQQFDPEKHAALMQVESEEYPSGTVVEEHTKGYLINDRVLRHSQVLVSK